MSFNNVDWKEDLEETKESIQHTINLWNSLLESMMIAKDMEGQVYQVLLVLSLNVIWGLYEVHL